MKVKLTHYCNVPGCKGQPGSVIDVSESEATYLIGRDGAVRLNAAPSPVVKAVVPEPVETASVVPAENAATRTHAPKHRGK